MNESVKVESCLFEPSFLNASVHERRGSKVNLHGQIVKGQSHFASFYPLLQIKGHSSVFLFY
jgi:hypothetical protein